MRFHTIIWPIILMALELELPKKVYGHGWLVVDGDKMSKSKGNVIDPVALIDEFGADSIRYFLLREINLGLDGNFSREALIQRINADLANDLGNLLHRTLSMVNKFNGGLVKNTKVLEDVDTELIALAQNTVKQYQDSMDKMEISVAIRTVWNLISRSNKYIDLTGPWALAKDESKQERLQTVMYNLIESLRIISVLIAPFMPNTAPKIWKQLGLGEFSKVKFKDIKEWGTVMTETKVEQPEQIFPRIEEEKAEAVAKTVVPAVVEQKKDEVEITIDEFAKVDLRVVKVLAAEKVEKADKLLKLKVDLGTEQREIVSGIAKHYAPEELVGKNVVMVINLKPAKIRGIVSQGMVLAASCGDELKVVEVEMPEGSKVK